MIIVDIEVYESSQLQGTIYAYETSHYLRSLRSPSSAVYGLCFCTIVVIITVLQLQDRDVSTHCLSAVDAWYLTGKYFDTLFDASHYNRSAFFSCFLWSRQPQRLPLSCSLWLAVFCCSLSPSFVTGQAFCFTAVCRFVCLFVSRENQKVKGGFCAVLETGLYYNA